MTNAPDFALTPPPTRQAKPPQAEEAQGEMFTGSEMFQIGTQPIIGREVGPGEVPLFSEVRRDEEENEVLPLTQREPTS